jgi:hypothetical protein
MLRRQHGGVSSDESDSDLDDRAAYARGSRAKRQGTNGNGHASSSRRAGKRRQDAYLDGDVDMDNEDDDDPCRAKRRTFFSNRGKSRSQGAGGMNVNGTIGRRLNGIATNGHNMDGGIGTGAGAGAGAAAVASRVLNGVVVEGWEGSRANSPMSVS